MHLKIIVFIFFILFICAGTVYAGINRKSYYITVNKNFPKTIHLYLKKKNILTSFANTGVLVSPTYSGKYFVDLRYFEATMSGKTPWKKRYEDKDIPFINYFNRGEAIHGFPRAIYGINRSLGCVELPLRNAWMFWKRLGLKTLVFIEKDKHEKPAYMQKNHLRPHIKDIVSYKNHVTFFKQSAAKMQRKFKFIYNDYGSSFKDIPLTSLVYDSFNILSIKGKYKIKFKRKVLLTGGIAIGSKIGTLTYIAKQNKFFFTDISSLKGTYIRSIYSAKIEGKELDVKKYFTLNKKNTGILSNITFDKKNNSLWAVLYSYSYSNKSFKNYLCEISPKIPFALDKKILLKKYATYLCFDNAGNLWLSGYKFKNNKLTDYIEKIKSKFLNGYLTNKHIKTIYTFKNRFAAAIPIIPGIDNTVYALTHSYAGGNVYNNIVILGRRNIQSVSLRGYVKNIIKSGNNIFFIDNILKHGIFYKTLYALNFDSNPTVPVKLIRFYGKLNGVAGGFVLIQ